MSDVTIFWRPGCGYCARLRSSLGSAADKATWRNIWEDDEARTYVAGVNNGNEIVPTVVIAGTPHTNPDPDVVLTALAG